MARGFVGGAATGLIVSVLGLGTLSILAEQPAGRLPPVAPQTAAPEIPPSDDDGGLASPALTGPGEGEGPSLAPPPETDGQASASAPDDSSADAAQSSPPLADTAPPAVPEAGLVEGAMDGPEDPAAPDLSGEPESPVLPSPQAASPSTPESESDLVVATDPAPEMAPVVVEEEEGEMPPLVVDVIEDPEAGADESAAEEEEVGPRVRLQGGENSLMADRDTGVTIRRPAEPVPASENSDAEEVAEEVADGPALEIHAASFDASDTRPRMSIVLIDDGTMPAAAAALAGVPFPVTIALDPSRPDAAEALARYRADGYEAAVILRLPEGAAASDVEVTMGATLSELGQTVAVIDLGEGGVQQNREATQQAMSILAAGGRGFVTSASGLNTATRAAEQAGVPSGTVYRDLDSEGQNADVIRRFVDQAAFRARQQSGVVLIGRMRPDTLSALILWGTANRASQVAIAPLSAVLRGE